MTQEHAPLNLISLKDAAFMLNISYREAYNLAFTGQVGYERLPGGKLMLHRTDVEKHKQSVSAGTVTAPETLLFPKNHSNADGILQNRYELLEIIKEGGYGTVQKAKHLQLNKIVALKKARSNDPVFRQSLANEAELLAKMALRHPNLPVVLDAFTEANRVYLVMDFIDGMDLQQWIRDNGAAPEIKVTEWARTLLDVLSFLHHRNPPVIHRDLKPSNIIIETKTQRLYLVDFGLAKSDDRSIGGRTPFFASPEHDSGGSDARSDIYSLGATLYYLLSTHHPEDVKKRDDGEPLVPLNEYPESQNISREMWRVIKKAMALKPADRWQSAREMLAVFPNTDTQRTEP